MKNYKCIDCGKTNVKLWRPYVDTNNPTIFLCANCAEQRQSPREMKQICWKPTSYGHIGEPTKKTISLPKWKINKKGKIPLSYGPNEVPLEMTDVLTVNVRDISSSYSKHTQLIPAILNNHGVFYEYDNFSEAAYILWEKLPN